MSALDCYISAEGSSITLKRVSGSKESREVVLTLDEARSVAAKLPRLIETIWSQEHADGLLQTVYPLHQYLVRSASDDRYLLLTMAADDGFDVVFALRVDTAATLGQDLANWGPIADG